MIPAFAMAVALIAAEAPPPAPQGSGAVQLLRDACIDTGMNRAAFEQLGRARRWRATPMTRRSGPTGWAVAFRTDGVLIMLTQGLDNDAEVGALCAVSVDRASSTLPAEVAALAVELGLEGESTADIPSPGRLQVWSTPAGLTLTYGTGAASDPRAVISLSRQIVTVSE